MLISPIPRDRIADAASRTAAQGHLARFRSDESGSLMIFSLMLFVAMLFAAGLAIDFMRYESTRAQLQHTMDRAVLAAASLEQKQDPEAVVRDYFEKAGLGDYVGAVKIEEEKSSGTASFRKVRAVAGATVEPIFLNLMEDVFRPMRWSDEALGPEHRFDSMPILAVSTAEEGISDLEISMVLDLSGSMGDPSASGDTKIRELRRAAKDFVYHMQCNPNATRGSGEACEVKYGKVSISVIPYAEQVSVGPDLLGEYNVTNEHNTSFCVNFASSDFTETGLSTTSLLQRTGHFDPWYGRTSTPDEFPCKVESSRWIRPLEDEYTELYDVIDALEPRGNTSIDLGMKWGTVLLDPGTRGVVDNLIAKPVAEGSTETVIDAVFEGRPYDFGQARNMKAVILMTDGENREQHYLKPGYRAGPSEVWHYNEPDSGKSVLDVYSVYNADRDQYRWVDEDGRDYDRYDVWHESVFVGEEECSGWGASRTCVGPSGEPDQMTYPEVWAKFTTRWYDQFYWLDNPAGEDGTAVKNARLQSVCDAAKNEDILVYTIGFEVAKDSYEEQVMRNCATTVNHFFRADGMNLSDVFGAIASSINQLRLTE